MTPLKRLALFYFFAFGATGALFPLLPLLLESRGLEATEISWVMAVSPMLNLFVPAGWGALADAYHARTQALRAVSFGAALATVAFLWVNNLSGALLAMIAVGIFRAPIASLTDSAVYAALGEDRAGYARIRAWGSVGFVGFDLAAGALDAAHDAWRLVALAGGAMIAAWVVSLGLHAPPVKREPAVLRRAVDYVWRSKMTLLFVASGLYYGAHATFDNLFALHAKDLGMSGARVTVAWALAVVCEVMVMMFAGPLIAARRSWTLLAVAAATSTLRWLLLSEITNDVALVLLQALHGITFGLWYISLVNHVQARVPSELRSSVHGVFYTALGLGTLGGTLGGGWLLGHFGGAWMFRASALAALIALSMYLWLARRDVPAARGERREPALDPAQGSAQRLVG